MASLFKNIHSLVLNRQLRNEYARYLSAKIRGRDPIVAIPFGGSVAARTFSEFHSVFCLMPTQEEVDWVASFAQETDAVYLDVGANVGAWSVMLARSNPSARVFAFEPSPGTFKILKRNVRTNGLKNITCENLAVSDVAGTLSFQEPRNASVFGRILPSSASAVHATRFAQSSISTVNSISLDEYCRNRDIHRINLIKIDVEGAEPLVLRGMESLLGERRVDQMLIEIEPDNLVSMGFTVSDMTSQFVKFGYALHHLTDPTKRLTSLAESDLHGGNYFCVPKGEDNAIAHE